MMGGATSGLFGGLQVNNAHANSVLGQQTAQAYRDMQGRALLYDQRIWEDRQRAMQGPLHAQNNQIYGAQAFQTGRTEKPKRIEKEKPMNFVKEYFSKHRELFMGLAIAIVLDKYLFGGAFHERLKRIITGMLDRTEGMLSLPEPETKSRK